MMITHSEQETKALAVSLAQKIIEKPPVTKGAVIISLIGDLGSGKTSFVQGLAQGLQIKDKVKSPTFLLIKKYSLKNKRFKRFIHIDAYRIDNISDLDVLGFQSLIQDKGNIILVEWGDKLEKLLPGNIIKINFGHLRENKREIKINPS